MEAKKEELIITREWLDDMGAYGNLLRAFERYFPNGGTALEVLKKCEELDYRDFGEWLVDWLPPIYPPLELNNLIGSLFYPNDVHIKGDLSTQDSLYSKGSLKVDGKLTVHGDGKVYSSTGDVNANVIDIRRKASIFLAMQALVKANSITMSDFSIIGADIIADNININRHAQILGDAKAKIINFKGGFIWGNVDADEIINDGGEIREGVKAIKIQNINGEIGRNVDADEIINDGGLIRGDVKTIRIENINGGRVAGKITYKRSDEHK